MSIYTKQGDRGTTSLTGGERVGKDDLRVEAYGSADELLSFSAYLADSMTAEPRCAEFEADLRRIVNDLMTVCAVLSSGSGCEIPAFDTAHTAWLESRVDTLLAAVAPARRFTLPGGHPLVSLTHVCRTICRRTERTAVAADAVYALDDGALAYLNRLSDYFYILSRVLGETLNVKETYWILD